MKNSLSDLNDYLFETIERLSDDELMEERGEAEINRAKAVTAVAGVIINNARVSFEAFKYVDEFRTGKAGVPEVLRIKEAAE